MGKLSLDAPQGPNRIDHSSRRPVSPADAVVAALSYRETGDPFPDRQGPQPSLRIGLCSSLSSGFLRELIRRVRALPDAPALYFMDGTPHDVLQAARRREIDVGFIYGPHYSLVRLQFEELWREPLVALLPEQHPLARDCDVRPDALKGETFLATGGPADHYPQLALVQSVLGEPPESFDCLEVERETLVNFVGLGLGVALMPRSGLGAFYPGVAYRPIVTPLERIGFQAVWRPGARNRNRELGRFLDRARALAASWRG